jgi:bifunctional DNase/RNase
MGAMVEMKIINVDDRNRQRMVWLQSVEDDTMLPIVIGDAEAISISFELRGESMGRPLTHDLLKSILDQFGARVERVNIVDLRNEIFYAELVLRCHDEEIRLDARPSDSIALALKYDAPVYIAEEILNVAGGKVKTGKSGVAYFERAGGQGLPEAEELDVDEELADDADLEEAVKDLLSEVDGIDGEGTDDDRRARIVFLTARMRTATQEERYEDASRIRDEITRLEAKMKRAS